MAPLRLELTGFPTVTTPNSRMMLGWKNWPMMAASWRNLTISNSELPTLSFFKAASVGPHGASHTPLSTVPNCPAPKFPVILYEVSMTIHHMLIHVPIWLCAYILLAITAILALETRPYCDHAAHEDFWDNSSIHSCTMYVQ